MRRARMRQRVITGCAGLVLAFGLMGCSEETARSSQTTLPRIGAPNYATLAPVPPTTTSTTLAPSETLPFDEAARAAGNDTYQIRNNDSLSRISNLYDITINELCRMNDFRDCPQTVLIPGREIIVPMRDTAVVDEERAALFSGMPPTEDQPCPDGSRRPTYEITSADTSQTRAARRAGVDFDLLQWINRGNPVWNSFVPGTKLLLPCPGEEWDEDFSMEIVLDPDSTLV